ncbi:MAG: pyruvate carboxyltransferase [Phycisphaerae bacterium]
MFTRLNRTIKRMVLKQQKAKPIVRISDTTLRDGLQTPGVKLDVAQRVRIASALADAGVHSIDVGFPAMGPAEVEAIRRTAQAVRGPILSCTSRTKIEDIDLCREALRDVSPFKRAITLFIGTSPVHREDKLNMTKPQIIETMVRCIQYAAEHFEIIGFGPEDASRTEPDFLYEVYREAIAAGAISIGFTDTVGILTPRKAADTILRLQDRVPNIDDALIGVHFHNDLGLATANSLACVQAGAHIVQGTINGIGERAGNTALEEVVLTLALHRDEYRRDVSVDPAKLYALSQLVAKLTSFAPAPNKAVVGRNIFRTEAGIHQDGILKNPETYMPFPPELIGAPEIQLVLGRTSGRSAVRHYLAAAGVEATEEHVKLVMDYLREESSVPEHSEEVRGFLDRLRPYMAAEELPSTAAEDDATGAPSAELPTESTPAANDAVQVRRAS